VHTPRLTTGEVLHSSLAYGISNPLRFGNYLMDTGDLDDNTVPPALQEMLGCFASIEAFSASFL